VTAGGDGDASRQRAVALVDDDGPRIHVLDEQEDLPVDLVRWGALARAVLVDEGVRRAEAELDLSFVGVDRITELNEAHLGGDGPTDVLSFPLELPADVPDGRPVLLGDVVVCPGIAARQAPRHAGTTDDELALLVVHGVLHVLGWDHAEPDEESAMQARERDLLARHHAAPTAAPSVDGDER
jgi:probable rRNA maturation factor